MTMTHIPLQRTPAAAYPLDHEDFSLRTAPAPRAEWTESAWEQLDSRLRAAALIQRDDRSLWLAVAAGARRVLRRYSSSFFIVTRFLPRKKRRAVEVIYAAVRYPDEIVDTFDLSPARRLERLNLWSDAFERSLEYPTLREALVDGIPVFAAAFGHVVQRYGIPPEYYRSFLEAMKRDADPEPFRTLDDLIESYVYGSAIVVGYFLAYVYGPSRESEFARTLRASRNLGIALQLTNFLRDIGDDKRRGRLYLPLDMLSAEGLTPYTLYHTQNAAAVRQALGRFARIAEDYYADAERDLSAFSHDCIPAIKACIEVYRALNRRLSASDRSLYHRESVPVMEKLRALPASKYWKLPLAYLI
jgi:phytoene synthase